MIYEQIRTILAEEFPTLVEDDLNKISTRLEAVCAEACKEAWLRGCKSGTEQPWKEDMGR